ncbi:MAG: amidohydrolase [Sphingomonas sp.]|nr:amidohydrolase [Sphingomonas sp.]
MKAFWLAAAATLVAAPVAAQDIDQAVKADMPGLMTIYRDFHAHPELSMQEARSPAIMAAEARKLGFTVTEKVGKTGIVAVLKNGPGPIVLIRADMDALPVAEQTGLPFASKVRGTTLEGSESPVMHACGHDTHMTTWIATARRMAALKSYWSGTLVMIGQPGEEVGAGADAMLHGGLYTRFPKPDYALAFHDSASQPAGAIGVTPGYALANIDAVDILVKGIGSHGAAPNLGKDPVVLASQIVLALQTLVSREVDPRSPAVVTVGSFHAGTKRNIISDEAKLQLTVRNYDPETRRKLLEGIKRIARGQAISAGLPEDKMPVVTIIEREHGNATFNDEGLANHAFDVFKAKYGARASVVKPAMVSEDFGRLATKDSGIKGLIFWVGGVPQAKWDAAGGDLTKLPSLHSGFWAPDAEAVIATATEAMTTLALDLMKKK